MASRAADTPISLRSRCWISSIPLEPARPSRYDSILPFSLATAMAFNRSLPSSHRSLEPKEFTSTVVLLPSEYMALVFTILSEMC
ncbi:MAG: hypothetical protein A4E30_00529 [Methanomassiliicoccales archaeon PtaB.Bin215]|nr:MAG: hypothetical protein A4E30_00529 [Methanomassiliicoccales archaeon PtaB.Bin215]